MNISELETFQLLELNARIQEEIKRRKGPEENPEFKKELEDILKRLKPQEVTVNVPIPFLLQWYREADPKDNFDIEVDLKYKELLTRLSPNAMKLVEELIPEQKLTDAKAQYDLLFTEIALLMEKYSVTDYDYVWNLIEDDSADYDDLY
jgi:hypothetical protein